MGITSPYNVGVGPQSTHEQTSPANSKNTGSISSGKRSSDEEHEGRGRKRFAGERSFGDRKGVKGLECYFFFEEGYCRWESKCKYSHMPTGHRAEQPKRDALGSTAGTNSRRHAKIYIKWQGVDEPYVQRAPGIENPSPARGSLTRSMTPAPGSKNNPGVRIKRREGVHSALEDHLESHKQASGKDFIKATLRVRPRGSLIKLSVDETRRSPLPATNDHPESPVIREVGSHRRLKIVQGYSVPPQEPTPQLLTAEHAPKLIQSSHSPGLSRIEPSNSNQHTDPQFRASEQRYGSSGASRNAEHHRALQLGASLTQTDHSLQKSVQLSYYGPDRPLPSQSCDLLSFQANPAHQPYYGHSENRGTCATSLSSIPVHTHHASQGSQEQSIDCGLNYDDVPVNSNDIASHAKHQELPVTHHIQAPGPPPSHPPPPVPFPAPPAASSNVDQNEQQSLAVPCTADSVASSLRYVRSVQMQLNHALTWIEGGMDIVSALPTLDMATNAGYSSALQQQTTAARNACVPLVVTLRDWRDKVDKIAEACEQRLVAMHEGYGRQEVSKAFI